MPTRKSALVQVRKSLLALLLLALVAPAAAAGPDQPDWKRPTSLDRIVQVLEQLQAWLQLGTDGETVPDDEPTTSDPSLDSTTEAPTADPQIGSEMDPDG